MKPEWDPSRHNTFETIGVTPQHLGLIAESSKKPSIAAPAHPAGALRDPKVQMNRKKKCMLSPHNTFNTVGVTPQMMGVPVDLQAGGADATKTCRSIFRVSRRRPHQCFTRSASWQEGRRLQSKPDKWSFDSVGATMVLVDEKGKPLGEPIRRKEMLRPSLY